MNAIISLCHFCELHGPSILFCTQAFHSEETAELPSGQDELSEMDTKSPPRGRHTSGSTLTGDIQGPKTLNLDSTQPKGLPSAARSTPLSPTLPTGPRSPDLCEACRAFLPGQPGFISHDHDANVRYISSQNPEHQQVFSMVRQACVRSLSCEVCPGREGPIFFGDDHHGHVFSYTFYLKDSHGRGLSRFYSVVVVMRDKVFLLNSWPFLVDQLQAIIGELQRKAAVVYAEEQIKNPPKPQLLGSSIGIGNIRFTRGGQQKPARSLVELTNDRLIFPKLHQAFTNVLRQGGQRVRELLVEGPPTEDAIIDFEKQEETEEGFVKLYTKSLSLADEATLNPALTPDEDLPTIPCFTDVRHLAMVLGKNMFHTLAYHTVIGNQVIVRGDQKKVVHSVIDCLQSLLPKGCCRVIYHSDTYQDSWRCNFLGYPPSKSLPDHVDLYVSLHVTSPEVVRDSGMTSHLPVKVSGEGGDSVASCDNVLSMSDTELKPLHCGSSIEDDSFPYISTGYKFSADPFAGYKFTVHSTTVLPTREPAVLAKIETALWTPDIAISVAEQWILSIKEEWMNKVKVLFKFTKAGGNRSESDTRKLLQVVGAQEEDKMVLKFWMTGLSVQYRNHMLSTAISQTLASSKVH